MTTNGKYRHPPPGFAVPPTAGFHSMHHILAENPPVYICLAVLNQDEFGLLPIDTLPGNKPREDKKKRKKFDRRGSTDGPGEMYLLKKLIMCFSVQTPRMGFSMTVLSTYCKMPHLVFARKRYTVTVNGVSVSPSWFVVPSIADFRLMYRKMA